MSDPTHTKPLCPHCAETITQIAVSIDDAKCSAILFCPHCGKAFGAQLLPEGLKE